MFEGVRPNQPPLLLKRVILSEAPKFGKAPALEQDGSSISSADSTSLGCSPYLQIFKAGHLVFTTTAATSLADQPDITIPFCSSTDGPIGFPADIIVQGDVLLRCRHLTTKGQRVSMFRAAFHTGYLPPKVLRLPKVQLDGACTDSRFPDDFFVDLIFEACDASMASKHLLSEQSTDSSSSSSSPSQTQHEQQPSSAAPQNEAAQRRLRGTVGVSANTLDDPSQTTGAYTYDSMLHRDSRFWDVISTRRQENYDKSPSSNNATDSDSLEGPTVGKRRNFDTPSDDVDESQETSQTKQPTTANPQNDPNAFSIGHSSSATDNTAFMDFFLNEKEDELPADENTPSHKNPNMPPKRDSLMEALNAIDDDIASPSAISTTNEDYQSEEEIVFDTNDNTPSKSTAPPPSDTISNSNDNTLTDLQQKQQQLEENNSDDLKQMDDLEEPDDIDLDLDIEDDDDDNVDVDDIDMDDDDDELQDLEDFLKKGGK